MNNQDVSARLLHPVGDVTRPEFAFEENAAAISPRTPDELESMIRKSDGAWLAIATPIVIAVAMSAGFFVLAVLFYSLFWMPPGC